MHIYFRNGIFRKRLFEIYDNLHDIKPIEELVEEASLSQAQKEDKNIPKFQTYEIKLTLRLKEDQLEFLSRLEREIMKTRSPNNRKERITKNSVIRAMVDTFRNLEIDAREIGDEEELVKRLIRAVSLKGRGNIAI